MPAKTGATGVLVLCLVLFACTGKTDDSAAPTANKKIAPVSEALATWPRGRLPDDAVPIRYAIELTVLPEQDRFAGHVDIAVELRKSTASIFLHGKDLEVTQITVTDSDGERVGASFHQLSDDGVAELIFARELPAQTLVLEFDYSAPFDNKLHGLYRLDEDGRAYAFTQLESIYARQVFPSFDQPSYKTPFEITLNVHPHHVAIANTRAVDTSETQNGLKRVRFATTEPLPTYLIALAVGELDVVQGDDIPANDVRKRALPFRGIAVHGKGDKLAHAMGTTAAILAPLETYFDIAYPYDKLDIIAVPDFEAGAMENAGAITFRERLLLLDDDASVKQRQSYASVMAHELAHMWFGDLVTMPWWDDIWLNEAFATWMSYKAVAVFDPGQRPQLRRLSRLRRAKSEDGLTSARQIREPVTDSHGIDAAFDSITYAKGGAVLNMFEHYLGADRFRDGVRRHLREFAMANADVGDFIASLASVSDPAIDSAFRSFLFQKGLPHIDVVVDCEAGDVQISQTRYLPRGSDGDHDGLWELPVCLRYGADGVTHMQCELVTQPQIRVRLRETSCPDWLMPDADFAGYYHWSMPADGYAALTAATPLSEAEWLSVGDSIEAGLTSGSLTVAQAWNATVPLASSPYPAVALSPTRILSYLLEHFGDEPKVAARLRLEAARLYADRDAGRVLSPTFMRGLARDEDRVFYTGLLEFMALAAADASIRIDALKRANGALHKDGFDGGAIAKGALKTALTVAVQDGDDEIRRRLLAAYKNSRDAEFRDVALEALAATRNPEFAARLRDMTMSGGMRSNEIRTLLSAHFKEPTNRPGAWRWLSANWARLGPMLPERHASHAPSWVKVFCDEAMAGRMASLFGATADDYAGSHREIDKAREHMVVCARRVAVERDQVRARFAAGVRR